MIFKVIEGGLRSADVSGSRDCADRASIETEAKRRLSEAGYDRFAAREMVTGISMPDAIRHFRLQVDYVAKVLCGFDTPPDDFRADAYWPSKPE